jgi:glycerol-3-phosphate cytidylyltransferase
VKGASELSYEQKISDISEFNVNTFVIGDDWMGKFDFLKDLCSVVYLPKTLGISSGSLKSRLKQSEDLQIQEMRKALEIISAAIGPFQ